MNIHASAIRTADDFLRWNEGREGKREFVEGTIVEMMVDVSRNHAKLAGRLTATLVGLLDDGRYDIGSAGFAVRTPAGIRYPDVFVDRAGGSGQDLSAREPVFLAEILSPASLAVDFGEKAEEYTALPSLATISSCPRTRPASGCGAGAMTAPSGGPR
ncbi:Uma2 family endonuclease [Aurantimonas sp. A2-1-M11]|uniref:Uma2 family endonuclease n=1 Tax=Aurantimonas sp. A2-1-M11 TaxID=3113712 RepID=UPI002F941029